MSYHKMMKLLFLALVALTSVNVEAKPKFLEGLFGGGQPDYKPDEKFTIIGNKVIEQLKRKDFHGIMPLSVKGYERPNSVQGVDKKAASISLHDVTVKGLERSRIWKVRGVSKDGDNYIKAIVGLTPTAVDGTVTWVAEEGGPQHDEKFHFNVFDFDGTVLPEKTIPINVEFKTSGGKIESVKATPFGDKVKVDIGVGVSLENACESHDDETTQACRSVRGFIENAGMTQLEAAFINKLPDVLKGLDA